MKIKLYRSATVGIDINGFKILQDPWLTDGEYYGSWSHYPYYDLISNIDEINSYNAIYVSHIHPDHCSPKTMKLINKKIPVYIHRFHKKFLKMNLERLGFKVIELENGKKNEISKNVNIRIFAADNCDPELCYKFTGCGDLSVKSGSDQIDTLSVLDDNKNVIVNVNDCPFELAKSTFKNIKKNYDKIDLLLGGYGGAGPYPQCFENLDINQKKIAAKKKEDQFLDQSINFVKELKPKHYLPFAGTYTLTGNLSKLQNLRGIPSIDYAYKYFDEYFKNHKNISNTKTLKLNNDETFDLSINECTKPYEKINYEDYNHYIEKKLKNKKLQYENNQMPSFDEIYELSKGAFKKFLEKKLMNNVNLNTDIYVDVKDKYIKLPKNKKELDIIAKDKFDKNSKHVIYQTDIRMLHLLLKGPKYAHWNNAEIGSHIKFFRNPDVFERHVYLSMCFFHN